MSELIIKSTKKLANEISSIFSFKIIGEPNVNVVAFYSTKYSLSQIIDEFKKYDWNLNIMQDPLCVHICVTPYNIDKLSEIKTILRNVTKQKIINSDKGLVSIYGMAEKIPNKKVVHEIIEEYLDLTTCL